MLTNQVLGLALLAATIWIGWLVLDRANYRQQCGVFRRRMELAEEENVVYRAILTPAEEVSRQVEPSENIACGPES